MTATARESDTPRPYFREGLEADLNQAILDYEFEKRGAFEPLRTLSENTEFDGFDVNEDAVLDLGDRLIVATTIYATLNAEIGGQTVSFSDSYPARVIFTDGSDGIRIVNIEVDVSSFFEDA